MKNMMLACAFAIAACACSECDPKATRCNGNVVQICDADEQWAKVMDCSEVYDHEGVEWACCWFTTPDFGDAGAHTCLPADECEEER